MLVEQLAEIAGLDRNLDDATAQRRLAQVLRAGVAEKRLQVLDRVAFDACDRRGDDRMQVDERAATQQRVELGLARGVATHQPLERGGLVRREVVHVRARVRAQLCDARSIKASNAARSSASVVAQSGV